MCSTRLMLQGKMCFYFAEPKLYQGEKKKAALQSGGRLFGRIGRLTLGELEAFAGTLATWFFTFLHPRVASEESGSLELRTHFLVDNAQGAGDTQTGGTDLAIWSTTVGIDGNIKTLGGFGDLKRGKHDVLHV